jgi:hypothetical protein
MIEAVFTFAISEQPAGNLLAGTVNSFSCSRYRDLSAGSSTAADIGANVSKKMTGRNRVIETLLSAL